MQRLDFSSFQPLNGSTPFRLVSVHPTEPFVALQAFKQQSDPPSLDLENIQCAIWNRETFEVATEFKNVVALAWDTEGHEIGLVRKYYHWLDYAATAPGIYSYTWERYSWPEQVPIHVCDLTFNTNWPEVVVYSPLGDLAVIQWFEADKSGLDFIGLTRYGDSVLDNTGLPMIERVVDYSADEEDMRFFVDTNLTTSPVFSPDGRYIVFCWQQHQRWWTNVPDDMYVEGELPARTGECHVGYVQIIDWDMRSTYQKTIFVNLPAGWQPSYEGDCSNEVLTEPVFIDAQHFQLRLPTGEIHVFDIFE